MQSSRAGAGRGSPIALPMPEASIAVTLPEALPKRPRRSGAIARAVRLPRDQVQGARRRRARTVVLNEWSLIAKCCA